MVSFYNKFLYKVSNKKNYSRFQGFVETVTPAYIYGWAFSQNNNLKEVSLKLNNKKIASTDNFFYRQDITKKFNTEGNFGFKLPLKRDNIIGLEIVKPTVTVRFENDANEKKLYLIKKNKKDSTRYLQKLLSSDLIGINGYFEGLQNDGKLHGWISTDNNYEDKLNVWFSCKDEIPIPIYCDFYRPSLDSEQTQLTKGFALDPYCLPEDWSTKEIITSFDKDGFFPLPQKKVYTMPRIEKNNKINELNNVGHQKFLLKGTYENLDKYEEDELKTLSKFDSYLDKIEEKIST